MTEEFITLNLRPELMRAVSELGYIEPTPSRPPSSRSCWAAGRNWTSPDRHRQDRRLRPAHFETISSQTETYPGAGHVPNS